MWNGSPSQKQPRIQESAVNSPVGLEQGPSFVQICFILSLNWEHYELFWHQIIRTWIVVQIFSHKYKLQEHSDNAHLCRSRYSECGSRDRILSLDPDDFQTTVGTSLSKDISVVKFSWRSYQFFQKYKPNCGKNVPSHNVEVSFIKFLYPDREADDFQN